ncbi:MAG TPA: hypothetical protein VGW33_03010 [Terriglobia bacterium]|nr:hypothetical protein [Terriglobia bacterium]
MTSDHPLSPAALESYLRARPRRIRWREWLGGRRYSLSRFPDRAHPLVIVAHRARDAARVRQMTLAIEQDWATAPDGCREAYDEILFRAPGLIVLQLRRKNLCGCLGHRHAIVREAPFAEPHEIFRGAGVGEMDIAWERVSTWPALPLSDAALDAKFFEGSRLEEFHQEQFRLRLLSVFLHETHHLVAPEEPEELVRERSLGFYREALAHYVEEACASLSLTLDRSFSRLG